MIIVFEAEVLHWPCYNICTAIVQSQALLASSSSFLFADISVCHLYSHDPSTARPLNPVYPCFRNGIHHRSQTHSHDANISERLIILGCNRFSSRRSLFIQMMPILNGLRRLLEHLYQYSLSSIRRYRSRAIIHCDRISFTSP